MGLPSMDRRPAASPSRENWIGDFARMLAVDTTFPPGPVRPLAELMEEVLEPLGFDCERVIVPPELWRAEGRTGKGSISSPGAVSDGQCARSISMSTRFRRERAGRRHRSGSLTAVIA